MQMIDRLEKVGRLILWLVISAVLVIGFAVVPLQLVRLSSAEASLREDLEQARAKLDETLEEMEQPKSTRLPLASMGPYISGLNHRDAAGKVWFTNVSPRSGVVCLQGVATNDETGERSTSLSSCSQVDPYASVSMQVMFAGGDLQSVCPRGGGCTFSVAEVDDVQIEQVAAK
jgi:hypothetical protein